MLIEVSNTLSVNNPTKELMTWCKKNLVIANPEYAKKARMNLWLGNTPKMLYLYEIRGDTLVLPFGVLRSLPKSITDKALFVSEFATPIEVDYDTSVPLYDYQEEAVNAMIAAKYGILQSAAGSGKTQMGIALAVKLKRRTLWLCHTLDLIRQSKERAELYMSEDLIGTITEGKLDEEKIKQLTGGEEISARALYQSAITFKPQFTLWLSCNDLPMVTDKSLFASERIKVVEFNRHFSPEEQDTHLKDELCEQSSMSGIFMWLVRGYIRYKERGLTMSGNLKEVVKKYERDNDIVLQFLENRCVRDESVTIRAKDLYQAFKIWAKSEGAFVLSARKFNSEMERHPEWFDRKSTSSGFVIYWGLKLKEVV